MNEIEPTLKLGLQIWWAALWRMVPLTIIGSIVLGLLAGMFFAMFDIFLGTNIGQFGSLIGGIFGFCLGLYVVAWVYRRLMIKGFGKYRLVVVEKSE